MASFIVKPVEKLKGKIILPGDKSIAHRAVFLSALAKGKTLIKNFPINDDCLMTISAFKKLGIDIQQDRSLFVRGKGLQGLKDPRAPIFVNESGTTMRLLLGVLAGQPFQTTVLSGMALSRRPMHRIAEPLRKMGAIVDTRKEHKEEYPPVTIEGGRLKGISYELPVASAQVKSAILLAGLYAKGLTTVIEPIKTRDHTERMLKTFGADLKIKDNKTSVKGGKELASPGTIYIPADISSAAFFIVAATILPGSAISIKKISLNPSRAGIIAVLKRMGANITVLERSSARSNFDEPVGDILVKSSRLKGTVITREEIPSLIDELPVLIVAGCFARGVTEFQGVHELRVKETDRINSMCLNLKNMGADIKVRGEESLEKIVVKGIRPLRGCRVKSFSDHRTAMSMVVAGLAAEGRTEIDDISCISKSFPEFIKVLNTLKA